MRRAPRILEKLNYVRGEKVLAHVGGPSGSGKTELVNVLTPKVKNIRLIDLDMFDDEAEIELGMSNINKNSYTDAQLAAHHRMKQRLINNFITLGSKPIIFFGHIEEAGRVIKIPTSVRILLSTSPRSSAVRRGKHKDLSPTEIKELIEIGDEDVKYLKGLGYIPMSSREIYSMVLSWSKSL